MKREEWKNANLPNSDDNRKTTGFDLLYQLNTGQKKAYSLQFTETNNDGELLVYCQGIQAITVYILPWRTRRMAE